MRGMPPASPTAGPPSRSRPASARAASARCTSPISAIRPATSSVPCTAWRESRRSPRAARGLLRREGALRDRLIAGRVDRQYLESVLGARLQELRRQRDARRGAWHLHVEEVEVVVL